MFNYKYLLILAAVLLAGFGSYYFLDDRGSNSQATTPTVNSAAGQESSQIQSRINSYLKSLADKPNDLTLLKAVGNGYLQLGAAKDQDGDSTGAARSFRSASDYYQKYLALSPNDPEVPLLLAVAYSDLNMTDEAINTLNSAGALSPANQGVWYTLGWVLLKAERDDEARAQFKRAHDLDPSSDYGRQSQTFIDQIDNPPAIDENNPNIPADHKGYVTGD